MMSTREQEQPWSESPADESEDDRPWVIDEDVSPAPPARSPDPAVVPVAAPEAEAAAPDRSSPVEALPEPPIDRPESGTDHREDEPAAPVHRPAPRPLGAAPANPVGDRRFDEPKDEPEDAPGAEPGSARPRFRHPVLVATAVVVSLVAVFILVNSRTGSDSKEKVEVPSELPAPTATVAAGSAGSGNGPKAPEPGAAPPRRTPRDSSRDEIPPPREKAPPSPEEEPPTFDLKHTKPRPGQLESQMERPPAP